MTQLMEQIVGAISKPPFKRTDADVMAVSTFLREKADLLSKTDAETLADIVRSCTYQTAECDDVVIRQGEEGYRMFVILRGVIAVYIDAAMTGEDEASSQSPTRHQESPEVKRRNHLERAVYGKFITTYGPGRHFGEAAMMAEDHARNATIIANSRCDFLVIDQELFDRYLKEHQQKEFQKIQNFVDGHPFFCHMSPKFKRLLQLSFWRETFNFNTAIVTQGEKRDRLVFIVSGEASVIMEPGRHQKQYSHLWPFECGIDVYSQEFEWLRESRKKAILRKYRDPNLLHSKPNSLLVRRQEGYAATERLRQDRHVCLCAVGGGEVLGDVELVHNLSTYLQTVICTSETQVLALHVKNLERLTGRRNTMTMGVIREHVKVKLNTRRDSKHGRQVQLLHYLFLKLTEEELPKAKKLHPLKTTKAPPSRETQRQHLLGKYLEGTAELVEPYGTPGGLIYKDLMHERTRIRANIRRRGVGGVETMLREARRKMNTRKPRSRRNLVESLKEMMDAQLVEVFQEPGRKGKGRGKLPDVPASVKTSAGAEDNSRLARSLPPLSVEKGGRAGESTVRRNPSSEDNTTRSRRVKLPPLAGGTDKEKSKELKGAIAASIDGQTKTRPPPLNSGSLHIRSPEKTSGQSLPLILEEEDTGLTRSPTKAGADPTAAHQQDAALGSVQKLYVKREVQATSGGSPLPGGSAKRLPPLAKVEVGQAENASSRRWGAAMKFVSEQVSEHSTKHVQDTQGLGLSDYETSEGSLNFLETRIKQFLAKYASGGPAKVNIKLPKLQRFKLDVKVDDENFPKPAGKVWVKKRMCRFANSKVHVKGHEHIRYHMVDELTEFDSVKKMQNILRQMLDEAFLKKTAQDVAEPAPVPAV